MVRYKIVSISLLTLLLSGCIYESTFTCEGYKNAGRACKPATNNLEYAIKNDNKPVDSDQNTASAPVAKKDKPALPEQDLYIKCAPTEDCNYKKAPKDYVFLNDDAKTYLNYKEREDAIRADELTKYSINISADNTPVTTKPKTLRVTILPYVDDKGRLNMMRRVHMLLQRSEWVLGDYLVIDKNIKMKE